MHKRLRKELLLKWFFVVCIPEGCSECIGAALRVIEFANVKDAVTILMMVTGTCRVEQLVVSKKITLCVMHVL